MTVMPERFENVTELEDFMTRPVPGLAGTVAGADGEAGGPGSQNNRRGPLF